MPQFDCQNNRICLSLDEKAVSYAVPFGGFISSCMHESSQVCMEGYSKVRINTYNNCTLFNCAQFKSWNRPTIVKPPFWTVLNDSCGNFEQIKNFEFFHFSLNFCYFLWFLMIEELNQAKSYHLLSVTHIS